MSEALRDNTDKARLSELHHFELRGLAKHVERGREKYPDTDGVPNWTLGGKPLAEYLDCIERHLAAIVKGGVYDEETGTRHVDAIAWNALAAGTVSNELQGQPLYVEPNVAPTTGSEHPQDRAKERIMLKQEEIAKNPASVDEDVDVPGYSAAFYEEWKETLGRGW